MVLQVLGLGIQAGKERKASLYFLIELKDRRVPTMPRDDLIFDVAAVWGRANDNGRVLTVAPDAVLERPQFLVLRIEAKIRTIFKL